MWRQSTRSFGFRMEEVVAPLKGHCHVLQKSHGLDYATLLSRTVATCQAPPSRLWIATVVLRFRPFSGNTGKPPGVGERGGAANCDSHRRIKMVVCQSPLCSSNLSGRRPANALNSFGMRCHPVTGWEQQTRS